MGTQITIPANSSVGSTANFVIPTAPVINSTINESTPNGRKISGLIVTTNPGDTADVILTNTVKDGKRRIALTYAPKLKVYDDVTLLSKLYSLKTQLIVETPTNVEVSPTLYRDLLLNLVALLAAGDITANVFVPSGKITTWLASGIKF